MSTSPRPRPIPVLSHSFLAVEEHIQAVSQKCCSVCKVDCADLLMVLENDIGDKFFSIIRDIT